MSCVRLYGEVGPFPGTPVSVGLHSEYCPQPQLIPLLWQRTLVEALLWIKMTNMGAPCPCWFHCRVSSLQARGPTRLQSD